MAWDVGTDKIPQPAREEREHPENTPQNNNTTHAINDLLVNDEGVTFDLN